MGISWKFFFLLIIKLVSFILSFMIFIFQTFFSTSFIAIVFYDFDIILFQI